MARQYTAAGIQTIIATPHFIMGTAWAARAETVLAKVSELQEFLDNERIPLHIYPGMEIAYHANFLDNLNKGMLLPLAGGNHYLLEPAFHDTQENLLYCVKQLLDMGKKVIIAHAERIKAFQDEIEPLHRLVEQGLEIQLNMGSLLDAFDIPSKQTALKLLAADCAHYLASDAHSATRRRPPTISDWNALKELLGSETLTRLCITHPAKLFTDQCNLL